MSFSSNCKKELCLLEPEKACCALSELCGLYMTMGSISLLGRGNVNVQLSGESMAVSRRAYTLLSRYMHITPQIHYVTSARFGGTRRCVLTLGPVQSPAFLTSLKMMEKNDGVATLLSTNPRLSLTRLCCMRAYLRGVMLGGGTMTSPEQGYHLELPVKNADMQAMMAKCFQRLELPIKQSTRKDHSFFYLKQCDQIVTFLTAIGAHQSVMQIEDLRVKRQVIGSINRAMNCDSFNLKKQMEASDEQLAAIKRLQETNKLASLPPSLQEIALLRLSNPDATLLELGQAMNPPLGKSGVNHRMRRLLGYLTDNC